jgi:cell division protein FtsQ
MKRILTIGLWVVSFAILATLLGFASRAHDERTCGKLIVAIKRTGTAIFITEDDVRELLESHGKMPEGKQLAEIDVAALEVLLLSHPAIERAEVFITIGGNVNVSLGQRRPLARIIAASGESYYFDERGTLMPCPEKYTAPVIVVNGFLTESYGAMYRSELDKIDPDTALKTATLLDDVWQIVKRIDADTFLRSQLVQVFITSEKKFTLVPRIGDHSIILGDASNLDAKLEKLVIFYKEGLNRTGRWATYDIIDLQYKNQIVCTKKKNYHGI